MDIKDEILIEQLVEKYGPETVLESLFDKEHKMKIKKLIMSGIISGALLTSFLNSNYFSPAEKAEIAEKIENTEGNSKLPKYSPQDTIPHFEEKVKAVEDYMIKAVENRGLSAKAIQMTPAQLVIDAARYNFDLPLALAQAHQESCFGTTPRAQRTKSVFSVGLWDNGHNKTTYNTQDDSIKDYMQLMTSDYLQNGKKDVTDLLKPGGFVNHNNDRYASDPHYENKIRYIRNKIIKDYPILTMSNDIPHPQKLLNLPGKRWDIPKDMEDYPFDKSRENYVEL